MQLDVEGKYDTLLGIALAKFVMNRADFKELLDSFHQDERIAIYRLATLGKSTPDFEISLAALQSLSEKGILVCVDSVYEFVNFKFFVYCYLVATETLTTKLSSKLSSEEKTLIVSGQWLLPKEETDASAT
jgi:hypothetical protein